MPNRVARIVAVLFAAAVLICSAVTGAAAAAARTGYAKRETTHQVKRAGKAKHRKKHKKSRKNKIRSRKAKAKRTAAAARAQAASKSGSHHHGPGNPAPTSTNPTTGSGPPQPAGISGNWNLVMDSEFTGSSLPAPWHTGWFAPGVTAPANPSAEQDCYSPSNVTFPGDGSMHLNVSQTTSTCNSNGAELTKPYAGAMVTTDPDDWYGSGYQYTYGVVETDVYVPAAADGKIADWPAVWATSQNWPMTGEDDIMEGLSGQACYHFHYGVSILAPQSEGGCSVTLTPGWHTFASDWQPGSVSYYYDGTLVGTMAQGITSAPMFLVLSNTVSSEYGGPTQADSMQVKYVRVWQS